MATFTDSQSNVASFVVYDQGFRDSLSTTLEEWTLPILVADPTTWGLLNTQRVPKDLLTVHTVAGLAGSPPQVVIDIGGGGNAGTLAVDNLDPHQAILTSLERSFVDGNGASIGIAQFLITG